MKKLVFLLLLSSCTKVSTDDFYSQIGVDASSIIIGQKPNRPAPTLTIGQVKQLVHDTKMLASTVTGVAKRSTAAPAGMQKKQADAMGNGSVDIIDYSHELSSYGFSGGDGRERNVTIGEWYGFSGYEVVVTYINNPDGSVSVKNVSGGLTGFNLATVWDQASYSANAVGKIVSFTVLGYDNYNLITDASARYWSQPMTIKGDYNVETGVYHMIKYPRKASGAKEN